MKINKPLFNFMAHYWDIPLIKEDTSSAITSTSFSVMVISHLLWEKYFILRIYFFHKIIYLH